MLLSEDGSLYTVVNNFFEKVSVGVEASNIYSGRESGFILIDDDHFYEWRNGKIKKLDQNVGAPVSYTYDQYSEYYLGSSSVFITQDKDSIRCDLPYGIIADSVICISQINQRTDALIELGITELCRDDIFYYYPPTFSPRCATLTYDLSFLIGSENSGLWIFENNAYKKFYVPGVEFPTRIKSLNSDAEYLWILSHDAGLQIFDWNKQVLINVDASAEHFGADKWNTIYTSDARRLTYHTDHINTTLPDLTIEKIVDGKNELSDDSFVHVDNKVDIHYTTNYSPDQEAVKVYYRVGSDEDYKEVKSNPLLVHLAQTGTNTIQLKATVDGQYYTQPWTKDIEVKGTLFSKTWMYVFGGLLFLLSLSLFSLIRNRRVLSDMEAEKKRIRQELELLKSKQRVGQLQLNPHFLFNVLNSIGGLIALNENKKSRQALNQFSKMMRATLDQSKEELVSIENEVAFLKNYLELERLIRNESFNYELIVDSEVTHIPPMIIQPFLENAIIHGFAGKKSGGYIDCRIEKENKYLKVSVTDNGRGRVASADKPSDHVSSGIDIIRNRLKNMDRWSSRNDHVTYEDLKDEQDNAIGTRVLIKIPSK